MRVAIQEICNFACAEPNHKSFIGGESILEAGHLIKCGLQPSDRNLDEVYNIIAFCLQTSHLKDAPHEIVGAIAKTGQIMGMSCSCKAGLSEACKHIVATLLFCNRNDYDKLQIITCTDKKCVWSAPQKAALEKYEPNPLAQHSCFELIKQKILDAPSKKHKKKNCEATEPRKQLELTEEENKILFDMMVLNLPCSALSEHT
ncbi:GSCOCG00011782001-RA-CDS [Cotesia congregata]|nr:GSCOCG00011782001-RA-CDS [Cotesia congregata]